MAELLEEEADLYLFDELGDLHMAYPKLSKEFLKLFRQEDKFIIGSI